MLKPLTIAAIGLAVTNAFLLPPEVADAAAENVNNLPFDLPKIAGKHEISLDCPGCPVQLKSHHGNFRVQQGINSHLDLAFSIDHQPQHDRLLVNGFELYPNLDPLTQVLSAPQVADFEGGRVAETLAPQLGFTLRSQGKARDEAGLMDLISIDLQIIEVANSFVDGIPNVHVKLIQTDQGALMIGGVETTESRTVQANPMDKQEECTTIVCKWRAIVADRLKQMPHKCAKMAGMGHRKGPHHPHHQQSGHPHRFHFHEHSWGRLFKNLGSHILFPVFVGIVAGVGVSIIGMMVGTVIIGLWRVLVRGQPFFHRRRHTHSHSHSHNHHRSSRKESAAAAEKSGLMENEDPPPTYEENKDDTTA